ncbi:hypothetical protein BIW11_02750 [Tropilaelaps mercedesae]|uniref:Uncharacterized protein n=1 Tax=Tropilaelaps mercedesae TaxID=418985 RepID=A0A1V9XY83_9ACAR|nr:hypothetical protein BIW11_02750 [Tropilaelaps mercedesae]
MAKLRATIGPVSRTKAASGQGSRRVDILWQSLELDLGRSLHPNSGHVRSIIGTASSATSRTDGEIWRNNTKWSIATIHTIRTNNSQTKRQCRHDRGVRSPDLSAINTLDDGWYALDLKQQQPLRPPGTPAADGQGKMKKKAVFNERYTCTINVYIKPGYDVVYVTTPYGHLRRIVSSMVRQQPVTADVDDEHLNTKSALSVGGDQVNNDFGIGSLKTSIDREWVTPRRDGQSMALKRDWSPRSSKRAYKNGERRQDGKASVFVWNKQVEPAKDAEPRKGERWQNGRLLHARSEKRSLTEACFAMVTAARTTSLAVESKNVDWSP